jgi:hypothetical protein
VDDFRVYARDLSRPQPVELASALHSARAEVTKLSDAAQEIMVMGELPKPKPAFLLFRGEYDKRTDPVTAQTPADVAQQIVTELARPEPWALIDGWPVLGA